MERTKYVIGIDPGFTMTGVVLYTDEDDTILEWATLVCRKSVYTDLARATSLAGSVICILQHWINKHRIEYLDVCIELPILRSAGRAANVRAYGKQMRLVQEIEAGIMFTLTGPGGDFIQYWLTEVMPTESKRIATGSGSASKAQVIAASPFRSWLYEPVDKDTVEALADAWAHGQASYETAGNRIHMTSIAAAEVEINEQGD